MIGTAIVLQATELLGWTALWAKLKADNRRQILTFGKLQPQTIPFVDAKLLQLAGHPTKVQHGIAVRLVKVSRRIVNTKAFEHLMLGLCNPKSKLHSYAKKTPKVVIL